MGGYQSNFDEVLPLPCYPVRFAVDNIEDLPEEFSLNMNVGIDESLLRYSRLDSTARLEAYSSELLTELGSNVPEYIEKVSSALVSLNAVPNAVGIGALAISMILHICFITLKKSPVKTPNPEELLERVFAKEKSSEVRNLMEEYLKRYRMYVGRDTRLLLETKRMEEKLSEQLTRLKNSMLVDGQMNDNAFNHWANGAAFHAQMLIHTARLIKIKSGPDFESAVKSSRSIIDTYNTDLDTLIEEYKRSKGRKLYDSEYRLAVLPSWYILCCHLKKCCEMEKEKVCDTSIDSAVLMNYFYKNHPKIANLKAYFSDLQKNHDILTAQLGTFRPPIKALN